MKIRNFNRAHFGKKRQFSCGVVEFDAKGMAEVSESVGNHLVKSFPFIVPDGEIPESEIPKPTKEISGNVSELKQVIADMQDTIARRDIEIRTLKQAVGYAEQDTQSYKNLVDKLTAEITILKGANQIKEKDVQVQAEKVAKSLEDELSEKTKAELLVMCEEMGFEKSEYTGKNKPELIKLLLSV